MAKKQTTPTKVESIRHKDKRAGFSVDKPEYMPDYAMW